MKKSLERNGEGRRINVGYRELLLSRPPSLSAEGLFDNEPKRDQQRAEGGDSCTFTPDKLYKKREYRRPLESDFS